MSTYQSALQSYVASETTQSVLAEKVGVSQVAISRYVRGDRFPTSRIARDIDAATQGRVPFSLWQAEMAARVGISPRPEPDTHPNKQVAAA